jgi:YD repeat-containing protein
MERAHHRPVTRTFSNDFDVSTERVNDAFEIAFGYDQDRLLTQAGALTIGRDAATGLVTGTTLGTTTEAHAYNPFGESTRQTAQANGAQVFDVQLTRDALGRITQRVEVVDGIMRVFAYGYDLAGRLTAVERNGTLVVQYTYDANGNRLDASGEAGACRRQLRRAGPAPDVRPDRVRVHGQRRAGHNDHRRPDHHVRVRHAGELDHGHEGERPGHHSLEALSEPSSDTGSVPRLSMRS